MVENENLQGPGGGRVKIAAVTNEGTMIAGHPGGMLPLSAKEAASFHSDRLPENLYVADASLLPKCLGNPPILTIIAMANRISKICQGF